MKKLATVILCCLPIVVLAAENTPWWQFWSESQVRQAGPDGTRKNESQVGLFIDDEKARIRDYFLHGRQSADTDQDEPAETSHGKGQGKKAQHGKQKAMPPGLQKKLERGGELPAGWQRKLARGNVLDGDLYARSQPVPSELATSDRDAEVRRIQDRIVRIQRGTHRILDVLGL